MCSSDLERCIEVVETVVHFIEDSRTGMAHLVCLPDALHFGSKPVAQLIALPRREVRSLECSQQIRYSPVFLEECASGGLGRMRRENRLNIEKIEHALQLARASSRRKPRELLGESSERVFDRAALGLVRSMPFVIALASDPVMLLCYVDKLKIYGKGSNYADRFVEREARQETLQAGLNPGIMPRTELFAECSNTLFSPEQPFTA